MSDKQEYYEPESYTVSSVHEYQYCPICGSETEAEEVPVSRYKYNRVVSCPMHGELIHG